MNRLLLLSAETPLQARQLVRAARQQLDGPGQSVRLLDLDGQMLSEPKGLPWQRFVAGTYGPQLWQSLSPALAPWMAMLELEEPDAASLQLVPGLATVMRMLLLAEQWQIAAAEDQHLLVVLPPLGQALELLGLAARGPELLVSLWSPLLQWWQETRQRLAQFELVLRLKLPAADGLVLAPAWHQRLMALSLQLLPGGEAAAELWLAMALEAEDLDRLETRLAAASLTGLLRQRLWIEASRAWALPPGLEQRLGVPVGFSVGPAAPSTLEAWQRQSWPTAPVQWSEADGDRRCTVQLPGVSAEGLQVHTLDQGLVVQNREHHFTLAWPSGWDGLVCRSAQLVAPVLTIVLEPQGS